MLLEINGETANDYHGHFRVRAVKFAKRIEAVLTGHPEVQQHQLNVRMQRHQVHSLVPGFRFIHFTSQAAQRTHGNQSRAARMLGMTRRTLQYRIDKFKIDTASMRP